MQALRYIGKVDAEGHLIVPRLDIDKDRIVEVIILVGDNDDENHEMMAAAESSLDFWNNPTDDAIWNHA